MALGDGKQVSDGSAELIAKQIIGADNDRRDAAKEAAQEPDHISPTAHAVVGQAAQNSEEKTLLGENGVSAAGESTITTAQRNAEKNLNDDRVSDLKLKAPVAQILAREALQNSRLQTAHRVAESRGQKAKDPQSRGAKAPVDTPAQILAKEARANGGLIVGA